MERAAEMSHIRISMLRWLAAVHQHVRLQALTNSQTFAGMRWRIDEAVNTTVTERQIQVRGFS